MLSAIDFNGTGGRLSPPASGPFSSLEILAILSIDTRVNAKLLFKPHGLLRESLGFGISRVACGGKRLFPRVQVRRADV